MRRHLVALLLSSTAFCALAAPQAVADSTPAAPAFIDCGWVPGDIDDGPWRATADGAVNMRSGAGISCRSHGIAYRGQPLDYHCFANPVADDDFNWTYARNVSTGVEGWIRNDLLTDSGSKVKCR